MSGRNALFEISGNSVAGAAQGVVGKPVGGLNEYDRFTVYASLVGAVGGTLDVYVQRKLKADLWVDWIHFTQLAGGAASVAYCVSDVDMRTGDVPVVVGGTNDAGVGAPALANSTVAPGHPGDVVRVLAVAGAGAAAAAVTVRIEAQRPNW